MNNRIVTSLTEHYNRPWIFDIRELIVNALDALREMSPSGFACVLVPTGEGGFNAKLLSKDGLLPLLEITSSREGIVMVQRRPSRAPLARTCIMMHSTKRGNVSSVGGFGEGLKVTALELLKSGHTLVFHMWGERWDWHLVSILPGIETRNLVVDISPLEPRLFETSFRIEIAHPTEDCRRLFNPFNFLVLSPRPILFASSRCQFLEGKNPGGAERMIFVNGVFLKRSSSISFDVNLSLTLHQLSADRDSLRIDEGSFVSAALCEVLPASVVAQRACFVLIEQCKGHPPKDLLLLPGQMRRSILGELQRREQNPRAFPLRKDVRESARQIYSILGYTPVELESAEYFLDGIDMEAELGIIVANSQQAVISDPRALGDVAALQRAVEWVGHLTHGHAPPVAVRFVKLNIVLAEPIIHYSTEDGYLGFYLHVSLLEDQTRSLLFPNLSRFQALLSLFMMGLVLIPPRFALDRRALAHIQLILSGLMQNPSAMLPNQLPQSAVQLVNPGNNARRQSFPPSVGPPRRPLPRDDANNVMSQIQANLRVDRREEPPSVVAGSSAPRTRTLTDVDDVAPPLKRMECHSVNQTAFFYLFVPLNSNERPGADFVELTATARSVCKQVVRSHFAYLKRVVFYCYFQSPCLAFYSSATNSIFLNLWNHQELQSTEDVFLLICHELAHLAGAHVHDTQFSAKCAKIVLLHARSWLDANNCK